jgi:hypothetical protein
VRPKISLRKALADKHLFGKMLGGDSWQAWRVLLIAAMGEQLTSDERILFTKFTGREREPLQRVAEIAGVIGRRGGKSSAIATGASYIAGLCDHSDVLAAGERGVLLCVAADTRQARIILDYCEAAFEQSPILKQMIAARSADALELTNGIAIEVRPASFRRLRGPTYIAVIADELAFWYADSSYANPDAEILAAVRPGLLTTRGPLFLISSAYAKKGVLWETYRKHYGGNGAPLILVAKGTSRDFNPTLPQAEIDRALEADRARNSAEYLSEFRSDIESFVALEVVESCVGDYGEMLPAAGTRYCGFCDPSGGSEDSFTCAVAHRLDDQIIVDALREVCPPFSPERVVEDFSVLLKSYQIDRVTGDHYAGEFPRELFRKHAIKYELAKLTKSDLFRDMLPLLNSGRITLPRHDRLIAQLVGLERQVSRLGKDSISHAAIAGAHDDVANACAGVASLCRKPVYDSNYEGWSDAPSPGPLTTGRRDFFGMRYIS